MWYYQWITWKKAALKETLPKNSVTSPLIYETILITLKWCMLDRINCPLLQQKFPENSEIFFLGILTCFQYVFREIILYQWKSQLSVHRHQNHWSQISKDAFLNSSAKPVLMALGDGPVWVYCQKVLNTSTTHDSEKNRPSMCTLSGLSVLERLSKIPKQLAKLQGAQVEESHIDIGEKCRNIIIFLLLGIIQLLCVATDIVVLSPCFFCLRFGLTFGKLLWSLMA